MIRVLMLDLGNTLVRESDLSLFPHVLPALHAVEGFLTEDGHPLERAAIGGRTTYWCPACQS